MARSFAKAIAVLTAITLLLLGCNDETGPPVEQMDREIRPPTAMVPPTVAPAQMPADAGTPTAVAAPAMPTVPTPTEMPTATAEPTPTTAPTGAPLPTPAPTLTSEPTTTLLPTATPVPAPTATPQLWSSYRHNIDRDNPGNCSLKPDFRVDVPASWTTVQSSCDDAEFVSPDGKAGLEVSIRPAPYEADRVETLLRALIPPWREPFEYQDGEVTVSAQPITAEAIEHRGKLALYQTRLDTADDPDKFCDTAVKRLFVPTEQEQRRPPPAITVTLSHCVDNPQYEADLQRILESFQATRTGQ